MKTIKIVRLEKNGIDIFQNEDIEHNSIVTSYFKRHGDFPTPYSEGLNMSKDIKEWFCAYKTIQLMQEWLMNDEIQYLISQDVKIYLLEVSEYQQGEYQTIFTKESIVSKEDITTLFIKPLEENSYMNRAINEALRELYSLPKDKLSKEIDSVLEESYDPLEISRRSYDTLSLIGGIDFAKQAFGVGSNVLNMRSFKDTLEESPTLKYFKR